MYLKHGGNLMSHSPHPQNPVDPAQNPHDPDPNKTRFIIYTTSTYSQIYDNILWIMR